MTTYALVPPAAQTSARCSTWDDQRWRSAAACRQVETELFFPIGLSSGSTGQTARAKTLCADCSVITTCLEFALATNQEYGVWGGYDEEERRSIRRQRRAVARRDAVVGRRQTA